MIIFEIRKSRDRALLVTSRGTYYCNDLNRVDNGHTGRMLVTYLESAFIRFRNVSSGTVTLSDELVDAYGFKLVMG